VTISPAAGLTLKRLGLGLGVRVREGFGVWGSVYLSYTEDLTLTI
jgi:hypothetical protein